MLTSLRSLALVALGLCTFMTSAQALVESAFSPSAVATTQMLVESFQTNGSDQHFYGVDHKLVHYTAFNTGKANQTALVIIPGQGESSLRYAELVDDLKDLAVAIYVIDPRGQGASARLISKGDRTHVVRFQDYVTDLKTFYETIIRPQGYERVVLFAHSMGGLIATLYAQQNPDHFNQIILSSPMLEINTAPYPEWMARALLSSLLLVGQAESFTIGKGPYRPSSARFDSKNKMSSRARFEMAKTIDEVIVPHEALGVGSVTNLWLAQSLDAGHLALKNASKLQTPMVLLQAGNDKIVKSGNQKKVCQKAKRCQLITLPGAAHHLIYENDTIRDQVLKILRSAL